MPSSYFSSKFFIPIPSLTSVPLTESIHSNRSTPPFFPLKTEYLVNSLLKRLSKWHYIAIVQRKEVNISTLQRTVERSQAVYLHYENKVNKMCNIVWQTAK